MPVTVVETTSGSYRAFDITIVFIGPYLVSPAVLWNFYCTNKNCRGFLSRIGFFIRTNKKLQEAPGVLWNFIRTNKNCKTFLSRVGSSWSLEFLFVRIKIAERFEVVLLECSRASRVGNSGVP